MPNWIENSLSAEQIWVGLTDEGQEGSWQWLKDQSSVMSPMQWCPGRPDNYYGNQNCAVMNVCGWPTDDDNCATLHPFICEFTGIIASTIFYSQPNFSQEMLC